MGVMSLRPYQNEAVEAIENEWKSGHKRTLLVLPTGCHEPDQGILMFDGSIKKAKDIAVGDILMGDNGMPRTVLKLHHGTDMMYKVVPIKGSPFIVNGEHVLPLVRTSECRNDKNSGRVDCIKVKDYLNETQNYKHLHKLYRSDALMAFGGDDTQLPMLPIDPYFLGVLLGDGGLTQSITITTPEPEIAAEIFKQAQKYRMTIRTEPAGAAQTFHMRSFTLGCKGSALRQRLKALNIMGHDAHTKRIPQMYKTAPYAERLQVLAGLIDTDGHLTFNGYNYISASETLAYDVAFISRSVGLAAYITPCEKGYGDSFKGKYWRVSISGCCDRIPLRVERKRSKERLQKKNVLRTGIREISLVGEGEYFGFTVDGNNLYLMEDFTVTHNCGKTIVFSKVVADTVEDGGRALILAHRGELLQQAADKLKNTTGIDSALDKAASHGAESFLPVTVGSIQTLMRDNRLQEYDPDHFDTIVVDEAHHALSESYKKVLDYFTGNVLGVTATPDRGDMKSLGEFFESLAYEYTLPQAIREGYLCPIKAQTIPLNIDLTKVRTQQGDYATGDLGNALEPYLDQIADTIAEKYADRKMVVFLPLIATSQHFCQLLIDRGLNALEVNGNSKDRDEVIKTFDSMDRGILCNSMLLTEGWDCPSVDCIVVLRPTKIRSLYCQMVGRGTRLCDGKDHLLILDFLWMTTKHELCRPTCLICKKEEIAKAIENKMDTSGEVIDINDDTIKDVEEDVRKQREDALAKELAEQRKKKAKLVDPLQFEMSILDEDLQGYEPTFGWEMEQPTQRQLETIEKMGLNPDGITTKGYATMLLDRLMKRIQLHMSTPKQIRLLERYGFKNVGAWAFDEASKMISRVHMSGWSVPRGVVASEYIPESLKKAPMDTSIFAWD